MGQTARSIHIMDLKSGSFEFFFNILFLPYNSYSKVIDLQFIHFLYFKIIVSSIFCLDNI